MDHLIDEERLVFALGGVLGVEADGEVVEVLPGFMGQDGEPAAETGTFGAWHLAFACGA